MTDRPMVTVTVPADCAQLIAETLRAGAAAMVQADLGQPAGTPAYDARPALELARQLRDVARLCHESWPTADQWVTVASACESVGGVSRRTLHRRAESGEIRAKRCDCGQTLLVHLDDVEREARRKANR